MNVISVEVSHERGKNWYPHILPTLSKLSDAVRYPAESEHLTCAHVMAYTVENTLVMSHAVDTLNNDDGLVGCVPVKDVSMETSGACKREKGVHKDRITVSL